MNDVTPSDNCFCTAGAALSDDAVVRGAPGKTHDARDLRRLPSGPGCLRPGIRPRAPQDDETRQCGGEGADQHGAVYAEVVEMRRFGRVGAIKMGKPAVSDNCQ
jgi:hypothetical protein